MGSREVKSGGPEDVGLFTLRGVEGVATVPAGGIAALISSHSRRSPAMSAATTLTPSASSRRRWPSWSRAVGAVGVVEDQEVAAVPNDLKSVVSRP